MAQPRETEGAIIPLQIKINASEEGIRPNEYVRRVIQSAISLGHPLVGVEDPFVIMGLDGFDGQFYPCGSFPKLEDARDRVGELIAEEDLYSSDHMAPDGTWESDGLTNTFIIFTRDGFVVPLEKPKAE